MADTNPLERLLDSLPAATSKDKRTVIQAELKDAGLWEHYRQNMRKPGSDLGKMDLRAAVIFKRHLGLNDSFFIGTAEQQEQEIKRIARHYYDQVVSAV